MTKKWTLSAILISVVDGYALYKGIVYLPQTLEEFANFAIVCMAVALTFVYFDIRSAQKAEDMEETIERLLRERKEYA